MTSDTEATNICPTCKQCVHCAHPSWPCPKAQEAQSEAPSVDEILTQLENEVARDVSLRMFQHRSGRSPKSSHAEAKAKINRLIIDELEKLVTIPTDKRIGAIRARIQELKDE